MVTKPPAPANEPPRYKQAIVTFLGIYPLIMVFMLFFGSRLQGLPLWLNNLVVCVVLVPTLTFVILPLLNKLLAGWLIPTRYQGPDAPGAE